MAGEKNLLKTLQECNEACHELWIGSIDSASSYWDDYWDENINAMKKRIKIWSLVDKKFKNHLDRMFPKTPFEPMKKGNEDKAIVHKSIDKIVEANEDYVGYLATISNMIAKEQLKAMKKNTETLFSIFGDYLKSFSGENDR